MDLELINNIINENKNDKFIQSFIKELKNHIQKEIFKNNHESPKKEDIQLINPTYKENKIITKYRDQMYIERSNILNNYAKQTAEKGKMYYIYSKNSKIENCYNLCICEEGKSNIVIQVTENNLPKDAKIGSVLRMVNEKYILDAQATDEISNTIQKMKDEIIEKQCEFLRSKRIEGHIYEISEIGKDRAWLIDITDSNANFKEGIEEIDFPKELLKDVKEGDLFIYKNGEYEKYLEN